MLIRSGTPKIDVLNKCLEPQKKKTTKTLNTKRTLEKIKEKEKRTDVEIEHFPIDCAVPLVFGSVSVKLTLQIQTVPRVEQSQTGTSDKN